MARVCLHKAAKRSKKWVDRKKRDARFQEGDLVLMKLHLMLRPKRIHKGLVRRYEGPFKVLRMVGKVAYKLEFPTKLKVHPVFHVSMLNLSMKIRVIQLVVSLNENQLGSRSFLTGTLRASLQIELSRGRTTCQGMST